MRITTAGRRPRVHTSLLSSSLSSSGRNEVSDTRRDAPEALSDPVTASVVTGLGNGVRTAREPEGRIVPVDALVPSVLTVLPMGAAAGFGVDMPATDGLPPPLLNTDLSCRMVSPCAVGE